MSRFHVRETMNLNVTDAQNPNVEPEHDFLRKEPHFLGFEGVRFGEMSHLNPK